MAAGVLVLAAVLFAALKKNWSKVQRGVFPVLAIYICIVLGITVFNRLPFDSVKYNTELFWSYKKAVNNPKLVWEILLNYFLLLPFGIMGSLYIKRRWMVLLGLFFSVVIELTQFIMRRGLFEFDDMIGNTLGVVLGVGIYSLLKCISRMKRGKG